MEKKEKIALNDELLGKVSGGVGPEYVDDDGNQVIISFGDVQTCPNCGLHNCPGATGGICSSLVK